MLLSGELRNFHLTRSTFEAHVLQDADVDVYAYLAVPVPSHLGAASNQAVSKARVRSDTIDALMPRWADASEV